MREELASLVERLEKATGPDRELDLDIVRLLEPEVARHWGNTRLPLPWLYCYTEKVDAIMSLVERILPGHGISLWSWPDITMATIGTREIDFAEYMRPVGKAEAKTAPLAICLALLLALRGDEE